MVNASDTITSGRHPVRNLPLMEPTEKKRVGSGIETRYPPFRKLGRCVTAFPQAARAR